MKKKKPKTRFFCVVQQYQDGDIYLYERHTGRLKAMQEYIDELRENFERECDDPDPFEKLKWTKMTMQHDQWSAEDANAHYQIFERTM